MAVPDRYELRHLAFLSSRTVSTCHTCCCFNGCSYALVGCSGSLSTDLSMRQQLSTQPRLPRSDSCSISFGQPTTSGKVYKYICTYMEREIYSHSFNRSILPERASPFVCSSRGAFYRSFASSVALVTVLDSRLHLSARPLECPMASGSVPLWSVSTRKWQNSTLAAWGCSSMSVQF